MDTRRVGVRFALSLLALAAVAYAAGGGRVLDALAGTDPWYVALAVATSLVSLACFVETFVRAVAVVETRRMRARATYLAGSFARNLLPWGNVASATFVTYAIARDAGTGYERALAAVAADEYVATATSFVAVAVGAGFAVTGGTGDLAAVAAAVAVAGLLVAALVVAVARARPRRLLTAVTAVTDRLQRLAARVSPRAAAALDAENVSARLTGFDRTLRAIAADRSRLAAMVGFGLLGWGALAATLHYAAAAVALSVPVSVALAVVPLAGLAAIVPLPGGIGSVDAALLGLLALTTGAPTPVAAAAALLYRLVGFWLHFALSAVSVAFAPVPLTVR
ncbi:flippase-like domain-containing protein [Salarchaeum japonicum]|uniref:Lysylphosphatidylglycerol synthase domain-containing protein n=1 Tax=Salarchaeum japonicum TaxID=555573 RepID=A0AAV3T450_9EURY|nr:flippase-like domain-containing protein [Salarchaeum japonicum]